MSRPAARLTDLHTCPMVTGLVPHVGGPVLQPGHPQTLIAGLPAARVTDFAVCVGPPDVIVSGSTTVFVGGLMAARMGDSTAHGGIIAAGCPTVLIGDSGGGAGSPQGQALRAARASGSAFAQSNCGPRAVLDAVNGTALVEEPDPDRTSWIELEMVDEAGQPVPHQRYRVITADGRTREGFLDQQGVARVGGIDPGTCRITFPDLDAEAWRPLDGG